VGWCTCLQPCIPLYFLPWSNCQLATSKFNCSLVLCSQAAMTSWKFIKKLKYMVIMAAMVSCCTVRPVCDWFQARADPNSCGEAGRMRPSAKGCGNR
jgi:hypothetical protein